LSAQWRTAVAILSAMVFGKEILMPSGTNLNNLSNYVPCLSAIFFSSPSYESYVFFMFSQFLTFFRSFCLYVATSHINETWSAINGKNLHCNAVMFQINEGTLHINEAKFAN